MNCTCTAKDHPKQNRIWDASCPVHGMNPQLPTCPTCGNIPEWPELSKDGMSYCKNQFHKAAEAPKDGLTKAEATALYEKYALAAEAPNFESPDSETSKITPEATLAERIRAIYKPVDYTSEYGHTITARYATQHDVAELIKSESQRAVEAFAEGLKRKAVMGRAGENPDPYMHKIINAALEDYRNAK